MKYTKRILKALQGSSDPATRLLAQIMQEEVAGKKKERVPAPPTLDQVADFGRKFEAAARKAEHSSDPFGWVTNPYSGVRKQWGGNGLGYPLDVPDCKLSESQENQKNADSRRWSDLPAEITAPECGDSQTAYDYFKEIEEANADTLAVETKRGPGITHARTVTCEHCRNEFTSVHSHQRFCSPNCNKAAYKKRAAKKVVARPPKLNFPERLKVFIAALADGEKTMEARRTWMAATGEIESYETMRGYRAAYRRVIKALAALPTDMQRRQFIDRHGIEKPGAVA